MAASKQVDERLTKALADNAELRALLVDRDRQIEHLTKMLFARKSERLANDKHPKLPLVWDEPAPPPPPHVDEAADEEYEEVTYKRKKRGATKVSKDLPRETRKIELPEAERRCPCCNEVMCKIGEEVSERLDYTPAVLKVLETRRDKYACKKHEEAGVLTPPVPVHPIEKGMATAGLLSQVLVAKYKDHLPLYRQSCIFARHGAEIAESTLCDWVKSAAEMLRPVAAAMKASVLASHVVQSDDTGITVLDPSHARSAAGAKARADSSASTGASCKSMPTPGTRSCFRPAESRKSVAGHTRATLLRCARWREGARWQCARRPAPALRDRA